MAYGKRYDFNFSKSGVNYVVEILQNNYTGSVISITNGADNPVTLRHLGSRDDPEKTVLFGTEMLFSFEYPRADNIDYEPLFTTSYKEFAVKLSKDSSIIFVGFLLPENSTRSFPAPVNIAVQLSFTDGIAELKNETFKDLDSVGDYKIEKISILSILQKALVSLPRNIILGDLEFQVQLNTYETNYMLSTDNIVEKGYITTERFQEDNAGLVTIMKCDEVIKGVFHDFTVSVFLLDKFIRIINFHELNSTQTTYDFGSLVWIHSETSSLFFDIQNQTALWEGEEQIIQPLAEVDITFHNKSEGGKVILNLSEWGDSNIWTTKATGGVTLLSPGVELHIYGLPTTQFNMNYVQTAEFGVTKLTDTDILYVTFSYKIIIPTAWPTDLTPDESMFLNLNIGINHPSGMQSVTITEDRDTSGTWDPATGAWDLFTSDINSGVFYVDESGNYFLKISTAAINAPPSGTVQIYIKQVTVVKEVRGDTASATSVSAVLPTTFDRHYTQKSDVGSNKFSTTEIIGDGFSIVEVGGIEIMDSSSILVPSANWNRFGKTENLILFDCFARNLLENRLNYKKLLTVTLYDPDFLITFSTIIQHLSENYQIISFNRNFKTGYIKLSIIQILTAAGTFSAILENTLNTSNGESVSSVTPATVSASTKSFIAPAQYEATTDGELTVTLTELISASIILIIKEIQPLKFSQYTFDKILGKITLTQALNQYETLYITYSKIVTT